MAAPKRIISKSITVRAGSSQVFTALTDPDKIVRCFPFDSVESDQLPGGAITFRGQANGTPFTDYGRIDILDPPRQFQYTYWSDNHGTPRTAENHLTISYDLRALHPGETELTVTHSGVPPGDYYALMVQAWELLLPRFKECVEQDHST